MEKGEKRGQPTGDMVISKTLGGAGSGPSGEDTGSLSDDNIDGSPGEEELFGGVDAGQSGGKEGVARMGGADIQKKSQD